MRSDLIRTFKEQQETINEILQIILWNINNRKKSIILLIKSF